MLFQGGSPRRLLRLWTPVWFFPLALPAQKPVINPGGIVNAASQSASPELGMIVAPGGIATIYGSNLASSTETAATLPLPTSLAGTSVTVNGSPAPLFYVSPNQINFQVPTLDPNLNSYLKVTVTSRLGTSDPVEVDNRWSAPGAFTQNASGCGPGAVLNVNADGTVFLNTRGQSASPGDFISIYGTGMGLPYNPPPDGSPAKTDPLSWSGGGSRVLFGLSGFERPSTASTFFVPGDFAGRAPGLVGVDQVNLRVAQDAAEGCAVPLRVSGYVVADLAQPVTISIRKGGGRCQDAPLARIGSMTWVKTTTSGPEPSQSATLETLEVKLVEAPGNQLQPLPGAGQIPLEVSTGVFGVAGPNCAGSAGRRLDAGSLTLDTATGAPFTVSPSLVSGELIYQATLPMGTIRTGTVRVAASGGADFGPFQADVFFPPPIQITTPLSPGTVVSKVRSFQLAWTGGTADVIVRVRLATSYGYYQSAVLGDAGSATLPVRYYQYGDREVPLFPIELSEPLRVEVWVSPVQPPTFAAPGLREPGTHNWTYKYSFTGLKTD